MSNEDFDDRLVSILESIEIIERRISSISDPEELIVDEEGILILDAISMRLQHLSEIITKISRKYPDKLALIEKIEWDKIIDFRNFISHHYDLVNHEIIYDICINEIPQLKEAILKYLGRK